MRDGRTGTSAFRDDSRVEERFFGFESVPQGLKPSFTSGRCGRTEQLAEKNQITAEFVERSYAEAKALIGSGLFAARLKSCPVTKRSENDFFASCEVVP